ncbi:ABC transporter substrate-binding protein [Paenibacillus naphthalenovorans]|uniref:ABC transporter substrate-binding protein n=1 Tax=Paenibacillus naphthalenovorans TaxID=162209 RepID=UPI00088696F8|nr:ABC transporter substrate-binding protein [Paenibacillus naphthalenovorans]SDI01497.1 ABC-type nitrate/sulfonate/bicarbonate transport system, substrate-binding protein [Paenibacillus naphthalenovorans]
MKINALKTAVLTFSVFTLALTAACSTSTTENNATGAQTGAAGAKQTTPVKVRLAIDTAAGGSFQFRIAKEKGFFQKHGIEPEISNFAYGIDTVNALLISQADTALAADYALVNSLGKGDMTVVSALTRTNEQSAAKTLLFARDHINTPEDFKGKKLGVAKGTVYEYVWAKYLEKNNIDEKEVTYVPYSTPDEAIVSLQKGDMDAVWIGGALVDKFKAIKGVKALIDVSGSGVNISSYLLVDTAFVKNNPDAVSSVLKALDEGIRYIPDHKEETAEVAFKELKLPKDRVLEDLQSTNYTLGFTQEDYLHLQDVKKWVESKGILKDKYELKDKINIEPLKKALPETVSYEP